MSAKPSTSTDAEALERRRAALGLAAIVGCDPRTAERVLVLGVEAIRPRALRERMRTGLARLRGDGHQRRAQP